MSRLVDYKIVKGLPDTVERDVKQLIATGWTTNGLMQVMQVDQYTICVQCMILETDDD